MDPVAVGYHDPLIRLFWVSHPDASFSKFSGMDFAFPEVTIQGLRLRNRRHIKPLVRNEVS